MHPTIAADLWTLTVELFTQPFGWMLAVVLAAFFLFGLAMGAGALLDGLRPDEAEEPRPNGTPYRGDR